MAHPNSGTEQARGTQARPAPTGLGAAGDTETVIRRVFDAFNAHRIEQLQALVTDDVRWTSVPIAKTFTGKDGTRLWIESLIVPFPDVTLEVEHLLCTGTQAVVEYVARGHHEGAFTTLDGRQIPPTGNPIELRFSEWFEVRGGLLAEARVYFDVRTLMNQLRGERLH